MRTSFTWGESGRSLRVQDPRIAGCRFVWSTGIPIPHYTDDTGISYLFDLQRQVHLERIHFNTRHDDGTLVTCGIGWRAAATCRSGGEDPVPRFLIATSDGDPAKEETRPYKLSYANTVNPAMHYDFDVAHEGPGHEVVDLSFPSISTRRLLFRIFDQGRLVVGGCRIRDLRRRPGPVREIYVQRHRPWRSAQPGRADLGWTAEGRPVDPRRHHHAQR